MKGLFSKSRRYRITVEQIVDDSAVENPRVTCEVTDREDIFAIIERIKKGSGLEANDATALAIGLRLVGTVMMANKKLPILSELMPSFKDFMIKLKKQFK